MSNVLITGSTDGIGRASALALLDAGHRVVVHARNPERLTALEDLRSRGAETVVADLSDMDGARALATAVNALGRMDAVIHNAGVTLDNPVLAVNIVAPYLICAHLERPGRLVFVSSSMHRGGHTELDGLDWVDARGAQHYSDSKLFVTTLSTALARLWPDVIANAVDPGWVATKMGGADAPDDFELGHRTQEWLAVSDDAEARTSGGYWFHQARQETHPAVHDEAFQERLLEALAQHTGDSLPR
jgi:NAD(P)-dependent dehydrogenase (short-subunit alcohol dehydrogenase family)